MLFHVDFPVREDDVIGEGEIDGIRHADGSLGMELLSSYVPDIAALTKLKGAGTEFWGGVQHRVTPMTKLWPCP